MSTYHRPRWTYRHFITLLFGAVCGVIIGACAGMAYTNTIENPTPESTLVQPDGATVVIRNSNWNYARVYISENGNTPIRIASVETGRDEKVHIRIHPGAFYSFIVMPLASDQPYTSPAVSAEPGDTLYLGIGQTLSFSTVTRAVKP